MISGSSGAPEGFALAFHSNAGFIAIDNVSGDTTFTVNFEAAFDVAASASADSVAYSAFADIFALIFDDSGTDIDGEISVVADAFIGPLDVQDDFMDPPFLFSIVVGPGGLRDVSVILDAFGLADTQVVPNPSSIALLGLGLLGVFGARTRRAR